MYVEHEPFDDFELELKQALQRRPAPPSLKRSAGLEPGLTRRWNVKKTGLTLRVAGAIAERTCTPGVDA